MQTTRGKQMGSDSASSCFSLSHPGLHCSSEFLSNCKKCIQDVFAELGNAAKLKAKPQVSPRFHGLVLCV